MDKNLSSANAKEKRNSNSLFTIDELRLWAKMNGYHYVEDSEIWRDKFNCLKTTQLGKNQWLCKRFIFSKHNDLNDWYMKLNINTLDFKKHYSNFWIYDIVETTLPEQKSNGEYYSMINCAIKSNNPCISQKDFMNSDIKIYDIKDKCWIKPIVNKEADRLYYNGFARL